MKIKFNLNDLKHPWSITEKNNFDLLGLPLGEELENSNEKRNGSNPCCSWGLTLVILVVSTLVSFLSFYFIWEMRDPFQPIGTFHLDILNSKYQVQISWSNCGTLKYGKINMLNVEPAPISLRQNLTISADIDVFEDIEAPVTIKLTLKKKIWFKMLTIPCIDNFGSCTYDNVCQYSPYPQNSSCIFPLPNSHVPCNCPVKKGRYFANKSVVHIKDPMKYIPKWLKYGTYSVEVKGYSKDINIGCYKFNFKVRS